MAALGKFTDINLAEVSTLQGGTWSPTLTLQNLKGGNYIGAPARCEDATSLAKSQFAVVLPEPRLVSMVALMFHTMTLSAKYRIRVSGEDSTSNFISFSDLKTGAPWALTAGAATSAIVASPAPDGSGTCRRITVTGVGTTLRFGSAVGGTAGQYYAGSLWIRTADGSASAVQLDVNDAVTVNPAVSSTWARLGVAGRQAAQVYRFFDVSLNPGVYDLYGVQLEPGQVITSYYDNPTNAPAVRPAGYIDSWQSYDLNTGWLDVYPSIYDPVDLEWGAENWWTGTVTQAEIDLLPRHRWAVFQETLAQGIRVELDDRTNAAGWFDVGGLWVAAGWSPTFNFERGRDLSVNARDLQDEAPSGRVFSEERTPRRQLSVNYSMLSDPEARRWFDAAMRARTTRPVIFLPDTDDEAALMREAFPATFERPPGARFNTTQSNTVAPVFKEILA